MIIAPVLYGASLYIGSATWTVTSGGAVTPTVAADRGYLLTKDDSVSRGAEWRAPLTSFFSFNGAPADFVIASAETEFNAGQAVLDGARAARVVVNDLSGPPGSPPVAITVSCQYSLDGGSSWAALDGTTGPFVACSTIGVNVGDWATLEADAKADVLIRLVTQDGDDVTTVTWGAVCVEFSTRELT